VDVVNFVTAGAASAGGRWLLRCRYRPSRASGPRRARAGRPILPAETCA